MSVKEWNEKGYCGIGEIRATTDIDYKYYNHALHKRIEDIDVKIHNIYEMHQHITYVIESFSKTMTMLCDLMKEKTS